VAVPYGCISIVNFDVSRRLPAGELVTIELTPEAPGEYEFSCQMGMLRGRLIAN
jgi:plastocyanin domain-containing protein